MNKFYLFFLTCLSALLLTVSWPIAGFSFLIFFAFVPLFIAEEKITSLNPNYSGPKVFGTAYLTFFLWNLATTWWIYNASFGGAVMAILANALLMSLIFTAFHVVKKKTKTGYFSLICFWIAFEYLHLNWDLSWPWLTLGNVFSVNYKWVQWYQFTGALGGSIWVLLSNISAFFLIKTLRTSVTAIEKIKSVCYFFSLIFIPIAFSCSEPNM